MTFARILVNIIMTAVLVAIVVAISILIAIPKATHGTALSVLTGSMTPTIPVGSIVVDRPVDPGTLHVGDVATYQVAPGKAEFITHRIVAINTKTTPVTFMFKGDANRGPDLKPVPAGAIRGKVWFHVPYLGAIRDTLHTKGGLAGVGMLLLGGYALYQFGSVLRDRRKSRSAAEDASDEAPAVSVVTLPLHEVESLRPEILASLLHLANDDETPPVVFLVAGSQEQAERAIHSLKVCEPHWIELPDGVARVQVPAMSAPAMSAEPAAYGGVHA